MYSMCKTIKTTRDFSVRFVNNLVHKLSDLKSDIYIANLDKTVNAKSVLGVLSAGIKYGETIIVYVYNTADGISKDELDYTISLLTGEC